MKDEIQHGSQIKKGFFAQEVEKIIPAAVSKFSDSVPDIFALSQTAAYNSNLKILTIALDKPHNLKAGDKIYEHIFTAGVGRIQELSTKLTEKEKIISGKDKIR